MALNQDTREFVISTEELEFLRRLGSNDETLAKLLKSAEAIRGGNFGVQLDRANAEKVRTSLTELLAKAGFEEDYSLTNQGEMLEELIDRFYIP